MQRSLLALGIAALALLASAPAYSAQQNVYNFQLDPAKLAQPGAMWHLGITGDGQFIAEVVTETSLPSPLSTGDACVTAAPAALSCTGSFTHLGVYHLLDAFGVYNAAMGATDVDVGQNYANGNVNIWRCHFNANGGVVGIVFVPPGSGFCQFWVNGVPIPIGQQGYVSATVPWTW
ncbi:MAG: hypothetical protein LC624_00940, partial [Halobacteriales archaeon]|nr:hypothetical protein [Halobacteriales archaeon]